MIEEGFTKMSQNQICTIKPSINELNTSYVTIVYYDAKGDPIWLAVNVPHAPSYSVIVTATGSVIESKDHSTPWIDKNECNHHTDPCETCKVLSSVCSLCFMGSRLEKMQISIDSVKCCQIAQSLICTSQKIKMEMVNKKKNEVNEITKDVEVLAKHYQALEGKTKRTIRDVRDYGKNLKVAARDYLKDNNLDDFWKEMSDMREVKKSLEDANQEHEYIKMEVAKIKIKAEVNAEKCGEKAMTAKQYLDDIDVDNHTIISIPVVGNVVGGFIAGVNFKDNAILMCENQQILNNLPSKMVLGSVAGAAGGLGGAVTSMITIPAGPYLWYKAVSAHFDAKNYKVLKDQFGNIALQMGYVEQHLGDITCALGEIEQHLKQSLKAEENVIGETDKKSVKKW
jgi:predicted DNA-binding protein YlxM (UPF0122 family)